MSTSKITITEALAELKTIGKRIQKKVETVATYSTRFDNITDPFEGGSTRKLAAEMQSVADLQARITNIRTAIQRVNLDTMLTIGSSTMSIASWLVWRREVATGQAAAISTILRSVEAGKRKAEQMSNQPIEEGAKRPSLLVNVNEERLLTQYQEINDVLGALDGKLSLINATTFIEV